MERRGIGKRRGRGRAAAAAASRPYQRVHRQFRGGKIQPAQRHRSAPDAGDRRNQQKAGPGAAHHPDRHPVPPGGRRLYRGYARLLLLGHGAGRIASGNLRRIGAGAGSPPAPMSRSRAAPCGRRWKKAKSRLPGMKATGRCMKRSRIKRIGSSKGTPNRQTVGPPMRPWGSKRRYGSQEREST